MLFEEDPNKDNILSIISDFATELSIHKSVAEQAVARSDTYNAMVILYSNSNTKHLLVLPTAKSFVDILPQVSEILHLYSALQSYAALIVLPSKASVDGEIYESINFFIAARHAAFIYYAPYKIENNTCVWNENSFFSEELLESNLDANGKDLANVIRAHIQLDKSPFTASEVLNYLSYHEYPIQFLDENNVITYIDMSSYDYSLTDHIT